MVSPVLAARLKSDELKGQSGLTGGNWKVPFDPGFGNSAVSVQQIWAGPWGQGWGVAGCSHGGSRSQHNRTVCVESDEGKRNTPCPQKWVCVYNIFIFYRENILHIYHLGNVKFLKENKKELALLNLKLS